MRKRGGRGSKILKIFADVIYGWSLAVRPMKYF